MIAPSYKNYYFLFKMEIHYTKNAFKKMCPDWQCIRNFGDVIGHAILKRIREFSAASCLEDMRNLPGRHEELTANRKSQLSCRLSANYRLIYRPFGEESNHMENGGLSWKNVTEVEIIEAIDYHGN